MMKKLIFLILATLISVTSLAQEQVLIPVKVLDGIIMDLTKYDGMKVTLSRKDSVITILEETIDKKNNIILTYKLKEEEYKQLNENLKEVITIKESENKDLKKELRKVKVRNTLVIIGEAVVIILLIL